MKKQKISFVIPVYNAEKKVKKCIKSIQRQTYKNIEIVCVNDGSKDNSLEVLKRLQKKDDRIVIIDQQNQGAFMARKNGIIKAKGDYIMFADADDYYKDRSMCEKLLSVTEKSKANILQFGHINKKSIISSSKSFIKNGYISKEDLFYKFYEDFTGNPKGQVFSVSLCDKMYASNLIKNAVMDICTKIKIGEDIYLNLSILTNNSFNGVYVINEPFYVYNVNIGVMSNINYTILDEYSEFKKYQIFVCDKLHIGEKAKFNCYLESIYFLKVFINEMYEKGKSHNEIINALVKSNDFECIISAKNYFNSLPKEKIFKELEILVNATPEEYLAYIRANYKKPKSRIQKCISLILNKFKK